MTTNTKRNTGLASLGTVFVGGSTNSISIHELFTFNIFRCVLFVRSL